MPTQIQSNKIMIWKFHSHESFEGCYDMVISMYLVIVLEINVKFYTNTIEFSLRTYQGFIVPMVEANILILILIIWL